MVTSCLGALGNLTIIVFAPGSYFDRVLTIGDEGCENSSLNASMRVANGSADIISTRMILLTLVLERVIDMEAVGLGRCTGTIESD